MSVWTNFFINQICIYKYIRNFSAKHIRKKQFPGKNHLFAVLIIGCWDVGWFLWSSLYFPVFYHFFLCFTFFLQCVISWISFFKLLSICKSVFPTWIFHLCPGLHHLSPGEQNNLMARLSTSSPAPSPPWGLWNKLILSFSYLKPFNGSPFANMKKIQALWKGIGVFWHIPSAYLQPQHLLIRSTFART